MSQPSVTSATITFAPKVDVSALRTALKTMQGDRRDKVIKELSDMFKNISGKNR